MATTPTNVGQINAGGDTEALFLKVASGRVLMTFEENNISMSRINTQIMPSGARSLQFPGVGRAVAKRHEVGLNKLEDSPAAGNDQPSDPQYAGSGSFLSNINLGEREVFVDDPLESSAFIDDWENFKSTFDALPPVAEELGRVLAVDNDKLVFRLICKGALPTTSTGAINWATSSIPTEHRPASDGAMNFVDANAGTDGAVLLDELRQVAQSFDEQDVPQMDRFVALAPSHYNLLVQNQDLLNRDFGGANGVFADGTVFRAWGMELVKTNHLPGGPGDNHTTAGDSSLDGTQGVRGTNYNIDAQSTVAVCWQRQALGAVRAGMVSLAREHLLHYGGTFLLARIATGYDILRPQLIARVGTATP